MKNWIAFLLIICFVLMTAGMVSGETVNENPSFFSFTEVVQKLPELWTAAPAEVMGIMDNYPDFKCWKRYDIIGCQSVNNKYSAEINVNFKFSSEEEDAEFVQMFFTMMINTPEDVQKVIEGFWLPDMKAANMRGGNYQKDEVMIRFKSENTLMTVSFPWSAEGEVWMITVDMGLIRG